MTNIRVKHPAYVPNFFKVMDRFLQDDLANVTAMNPAVNIIENENSYTLQLVAPGLSKSDFKVELDGDLMTISFEKVEEKNENSNNYIKKEFSTSSFKRTFTVNEDLNVEDISAKYENGILDIEIPKKQIKEKEVKTISIN